MRSFPPADRKWGEVHSQMGLPDTDLLVLSPLTPFLEYKSKDGTSAGPTIKSDLL